MSLLSAGLLSLSQVATPIPSCSIAAAALLHRARRRRTTEAFPPAEPYPRTVGKCLSEVAEFRISSDLKLDADLHNLRARNVEICARPLGVVMHEGE